MANDSKRLRHIRQDSSMARVRCDVSFDSLARRSPRAFLLVSVLSSGGGEGVDVGCVPVRSCPVSDAVVDRVSSSSVLVDRRRRPTRAAVRCTLSRVPRY